MSEGTASSCGRLRYNLGFACSGASDVGAISNQAARKLSREKTALMCCVAAIGAGIPDIVEKALGASKIVVIDGCDHDCAKKIMEKAGLMDFAYVQLQLLDMEKGETPVTDENIAKVAAVAVDALACHPQANV